MITVQTRPKGEKRASFKGDCAGSKGITSRIQSTSPAGLDCNGSLCAGNPIHPGTSGLDRKGTHRDGNPIHSRPGYSSIQLDALLFGPSPRRLILNRWHDPELRKKVVKLSRVLPEAERMARTGDRKSLVNLIQLRTYQQVFETQAIDGLFKHRETHPETQEESRLWDCIIGNSERVKRLKQALRLSG